MTPFYTLIGVPPHGFDPDHRFFTSWLLPPILLACLRALFALYCFAVIFTLYGYDGTHHDGSATGRSLSYFTDLTYWGLAFYLLISAIHTFTYARKGRTWLDRWPRSLQALHSLFYTTVITFPFLVTLVFWIVLYSGPWYSTAFSGWSNVSQHGLNSLFAICELFLPATSPPPWLHLAFLIILLLLYLALAYLTHATQGFYTYSFLDPSDGRSGRVAGYSFGIAAGIIVIFLVASGLIWMRRKFTSAGKKSKKDARRSELYPDVEMTRVGIK